MTRQLRVVSYAVNGGGIGHLSRLIAINRWIRRYAAHAERRAELYFLTTSEADGLLLSERMASFKLPSPTAAAESGLDPINYRALCKQWIWHSLALLRPDLLIVDTWPLGAFGELHGALDLCRKRAFIYRPVKDAIAERPEFTGALPAYDLLVVPEHQETARILVPEGIEDRVFFSGPVMSREREEMFSRTEARDQLGVRGDSMVVYVSAGGGGDPTAADRLLDVCTALGDDPRLHLVVGAGPLYRGRTLNGDRITWIPYGGASELMAAFDLAISAAGYNTFSELMLAGVPTLFVPQEKTADEQRARAERAVEAGAAEILDGDDLRGAALEAAVERWLDPERRKRASASARALVPENHARDAAAALLRLVLPAEVVRDAELALGDATLRAARECRLGLAPILELARALEIEDDARLVARGEREAANAGELADHAAGILRCVVERALPHHAVIRFVQQLTRRLPLASHFERAQAAVALLESFAGFEDWAGAHTLLRVFQSERALPAEAFVEALSTFLDDLRARGEDLYRGIERLSRAQGTERALPTNAALFARVRSENLD